MLSGTYAMNQGVASLLRTLRPHSCHRRYRGQVSAVRFEQPAVDLSRRKIGHAQPYRHCRLLSRRRGALLSDDLRGRRAASWSARPP